MLTNLCFYFQDVIDYICVFWLFLLFMVEDVSAQNFIGQFIVLMNKNRFCRAAVSCQTTSDYYSMLLKLTYMMMKSFKYVQMLRIRTKTR